MGYSLLCIMLCLEAGGLVFGGATMRKGLVTVSLLLLVPTLVGVLYLGEALDHAAQERMAATLHRELPGMTQQAKIWCEEHRIYPITLERARPPLPGAPWDFQVTYTDLEGVVRGVRVTCPPGDRCYLAPGEGK